MDAFLALFNDFAFSPSSYKAWRCWSGLKYAWKSLRDACLMTCFLPIARLLYQGQKRLVKVRRSHLRISDKHWLEINKNNCVVSAHYGLAHDLYYWNNTKLWRECLTSPLKIKKKNTEFCRRCCSRNAKQIIICICLNTGTFLCLHS